MSEPILKRSEIFSWNQPERHAVQICSPSQPHLTRTVWVVPPETRTSMIPPQGVKLVWWLRAEGWKRMVQTQWNRFALATLLYKKPSLQGEKH